MRALPELAEVTAEGEPILELRFTDQLTCVAWQRQPLISYILMLSESKHVPSA